MPKAGYAGARPHDEGPKAIVLAQAAQRAQHGEASCSWYARPGPPHDDTLRSNRLRPSGHVGAPSVTGFREIHGEEAPRYTGPAYTLDVIAGRMRALGSTLSPRRLVPSTLPLDATKPDTPFRDVAVPGAGERSTARRVGVVSREDDPGLGSHVIKPGYTGHRPGDIHRYGGAPVFLPPEVSRAKGIAFRRPTSAWLEHGQWQAVAPEPRPADSFREAVGGIIVGFAGHVPHAEAHYGRAALGGVAASGVRSDSVLAQRGQSSARTVSRATPPLASQKVARSIVGYHGFVPGSRDSSLGTSTGHAPHGLCC